VTENTDLQFERAQFDGASSQPGCSVCKTPLYGSYFEVNGHTVCEGCCYTLREAGPAGSRAGRVLRAAAAGSGAALAGAILYWGILAATGYEVGLIAIVVGFAVGKAVNRGARGRGGWAYQTLAIGLTYLAIVSAYVPQIVTEIMKLKPAEQVQTAAQAGPTAPGSVPASSEGAPATQAANPDAGPAATDAAAAEGKPVGVGTLLLALGALLLIACAAPFLAGLQNVIGLVIIGIGMYEAWKLNRRLPLVITGPHALASPGAATIGQ
jgi:hypothetical protein